MKLELRTHPLFTDRMVLQRNKEVPIWGSGTDGQRVVVECGGNRAETVVSQGRWIVNLPRMEAGGPYTLTVRSDRDSVSFTDVLFGDVWLAGGQSNMQWPLKDAADAETEIAASSYPDIRYYDIPRIAFDDGIEHEVSWKKSHPDDAGEFSAVAYHFAKQLHTAVGVPIGIIGCNFGATSASCWVAENRLSEDDELRVYLEEYRAQVKDFDWVKYEADEKKFQDDFAAYNRRAEAGKTGAELGDLPWPPPMSPKSFMRPNGLYETMLSKAVPFGIRGFIYYQGESDAAKARIYDKLLTELIANWRADWGDEALPFLFVQLAAFGCDGNPRGEEWALLRESQSIVAERVPHTAMVVALDCGEEHDIHPRNKRTVGERLALAALDRVYGGNVPSSGPVCESMRLDEGKAVLRFGSVGEGLQARGGEELEGFEVCSRDGRFVPAHASIQDDTVTVGSSEVAEAFAVRYGWANYTEANLTNSYGLPASPFRSHREGMCNFGWRR